MRFNKNITKNHKPVATIGTRKFSGVSRLWGDWTMALTLYLLCILLHHYLVV